MHIGYGELEDFLAEIHGVAPEKRTALKGRLKHFQRLGWPSGTNKGKGARVEYGIGQTMNLAMGMEMLQLGLTPERVVEQLGMAGSTLCKGFKEALEDYGPNAEPIFFIFMPESLRPLRGEVGRHPTGLQSLMVSRSQVQQALEQASPFLSRRFAFINMTALLDDYIQYFIGRGLGSPDRLAEAFENWQQMEEQRVNAMSLLRRGTVFERMANEALESGRNPDSENDSSEQSRKSHGN